MGDEAKKIVFGTLIFILLLGTLPGVYIVGGKIDQAKDDIKIYMEPAEKICGSNCTVYPDEWVIQGKEAEAELICMRQCASDMKAIKDEVNQIEFIEFDSQYTLRVAQLYCLLGLKCYATEIEDFINSY